MTSTSTTKTTKTSSRTTTHSSSGEPTSTTRTTTVHTSSSSSSGGKPLDNPQGNWHIFVLLLWLLILWILLVIGAAVPHIRLGCNKMGLFELDFCGWGISVIDWDLSGSSCDGYKSHLQAGGAFAIISILTVTAAIVIAILHDVLALFKVHDLLTGIVTVVAWLFMMITWAIVAGFRNTTICDGNFATSLSKQGYSYTHGFYLYLVPWIITFIVLVVWFLKATRVI